MGLSEELKLKKAFTSKPHEALLNIVYTGSLLIKEAQNILSPYGLTPVQFNVLLLLKDQTEFGKVNQSQLGKMLLVDRSNITGLVDRMEKAGYVRRFPDPNDRRVNYVEMTDKGRKALNESHDAYYDKLGEIMGKFSDEDYDSIELLTKRIREKL